jgi:site-specific recombinase XerC
MISTTQCIDEFCIHLEAKGRADRTIEVYRERLAALKCFADIDQVTSSDLDNLIVGMHRRGLAAATIAGYVQAVRTFFTWCHRHRYIYCYPAGDLVRPDIRHRIEIKAIRQEDLDLLIDEAERRGLALELAVILFLADTACRAGELRQLNLTDIDLVRLEAHCNGKTGVGILDFTERTAEAIRAWLTIRPATDPTALFTTRRGRLSYGRLYDCIEALAHELGIQRHNPHSIRHRVGQGWIDAGANLELVRLKLRHRDISTTAMTYGNQDRPRIKAATKKYSIVRVTEHPQK